MSNQQPKPTWPARPPYPTLSTPASASSQNYPGPTSNPSSTSSLSSDLSTISHEEGNRNPFQSYQPPVPSPTVTQNPHFSPFQPFASDNAGGFQMTVEEQEQLARLEAHLRGMQQSQVSASGAGYWDPRGSDFVPKPHDMGAVETRREAAHKYVRENALVSEAATRLMIREMEDVEL